MPSGKVDKPSIEDNRDGTVSLKYEPREEGLHELLVKYNGEHVQGKQSAFSVFRKLSSTSYTNRFAFRVSFQIPRWLDQ